MTNFNKTKLGKFFFPSFLFLILAMVALSSLLLQTQAVSSGTITATVTAQNISISVGLTAVSFGTVGVGSSTDTTSNGRNTSITATNDGNIGEKFSIKSGNSTNWTLAGSPASNTFAMNFCTSNCDAGPTWSAVGIDPSYATLSVGVTAADNQVFDLQIKTPSSTTFYTQQTISLTVLAESL